MKNLLLIKSSKEEIKTKLLESSKRHGGMSIDFYQKKFLSNLGSISIYYEAETDRISILMFFTSQELFIDQFKTYITTIFAGNKKFVFKKVNNLYLIIVSNHPNEDINILNKYLKFFHDLLRFRTYINPLESKWGISIKKSRVMINPLMKSMNDLVNENQAIYYRALESIEIDRHLIRDKISLELSKICKLVHVICHCIVLIGTKVLAIYSKVKINWVLKPDDLICIVILANSINSKTNNDNNDNEYNVLYDNFYLYTRYEKQHRVNIYLKKFVKSFNLPGKMNNNNDNSNRNNDKIEDENIISSTYSVIFVCTDDPEQKNKSLLDESSNKIIKKLNLFDYMFLNIKAKMHFSMKSFFHYCPGIIHFIYIDRMRGRIYVPKIIDLSQNKISKEFVKEKVWEMNILVEKYKKLKYNDIVIYTKQTVYCFSEWLVSKEGSIIEFSQENIKYAAAHYELYSIYLPFVATPSVRKCNDILKGLLSAHQT